MSNQTTTASIPTGVVSEQESLDGYLDFRSVSDKQTLGVWWWFAEDMENVEYLNFLERNHVSDIYLSVNLSPGAYGDIASFIREAAARDMRVAYLAGDVSWIGNNKGFDHALEKFNSYQKQAAPGESFYGMHLDVEPNQKAGFTGASRASIFEDYVQYLYKVKAAHEQGIYIEMDVQCGWAWDKVTFNGETKQVYDAVIECCDTLVLMSYRDRAENILEFGKAGWSHAKGKCKVVYGVECIYTDEGPGVSFAEDGRRALASQLSKLNRLLSQQVPDGNYGIAIHHMRTFYQLQD